MSTILMKKRDENGKDIGPKSILLVDDNDVVRKIARLFLETQTDLEICGEAVDGADAIEQAQRLKPDLIILDLAMPNMNGAEAAPIIKRMLPKVPIILFTLYKEQIGSVLFSKLGIDAVFSKPDGGWKLVECVRELLQQKAEAPA
ncbi:MAG TPA: response regulator transcription factor [Candidatus Dormibacteraeota bacterium]|jgi:DNA-binding NarL/FixJ family response regulator|nr:response regulator transcription factor [Candidatus Dormibacteraeota bacterium]